MPSQAIKKTIERNKYTIVFERFVFGLSESLIIRNSNKYSPHLKKRALKLREKSGVTASDNVQNVAKAPSHIKHRQGMTIDSRLYIFLAAKTSKASVKSISSAAFDMGKKKTIPRKSNSRIRDKKRYGFSPVFNRPPSLSKRKESSKTIFLNQD